MKNHPHFIFFADWMGAPVTDASGQVIGRLWDLVINPQEAYPSITALIINRGTIKRDFAEVPWSQVDFSQDRMQLRPASGPLTFIDQATPGVYRIRKDVIDQQVVDTFNHKVIRVNDVHFLAVNACLRVVHVDIGTRGLVRRLGWEKAIDRVVKLFHTNAAYLQDEHLVSWKYVKTISLDPTQPIQISLTTKQLANIPPADLGELIMDLDINQRVALLRTADPTQRARLFERLDFPQQEQLLEQLDTKEAVDVLARMSADEAVDLLGDMPPAKRKELLALMDTNRARKLSVLLGYEEDEAGGIMTTEYLEIPKQMTVDQALHLVKDKTPELETIYYLYVVDNEKHLLGTTSIRRLIAADPSLSIEQTTFPKPVFVYLDAPLKEVAFLMDKYKVSALPVVDDQKRLQGIITVDDVLHHVIPIAWRRRASKKRPS